MEDVEVLQSLAEDEGYATRVASFAILAAWLDGLMASNMARSYSYDGRLGGETELNQFAAKQFGIALTKEGAQPVLTVDSRTFEWLKHLPIYGAYIGENGQRMSLVMGESPESVYAVTLTSPATASNPGRFDVFARYFRKSPQNAVMNIVGLLFDENDQATNGVVGTKSLPITFLATGEDLKTSVKRLTSNISDI